MKSIKKATWREAAHPPQAAARPGVWGGEILESRLRVVWARDSAAAFLEWWWASIRGGACYLLSRAEFFANLAGVDVVAIII
jgi:hypothetical protein